MAVTNSIKNTAIGYGNPMFYIAATTVAATNTQTNTLTASMAGGGYTTFTTVGMRYGKWRLRVMPLTTATTVSSVTIVASNGTTTENVYTGGSWATNSRNINLVGEFITDLSPGYTNLTATVVFGAAATGTIDFELFAQADG